MSIRHTRYLFGLYQLDPAARELRRDGEELKIPLKVFECIAYLLENRQRAVGRDELISAVWGDVELTDRALSQAILLARRALDDTGEDQQHIKTVRGFGYHWVAPVQEISTPRATRPSHRSPLLMAALTIGVLCVGLFAFWLGRGDDDTHVAAWATRHGDIALLLPVVVSADVEHEWVRFGALELITGRLRAAGQPMVPTETVIAVTRNMSADPGAEALQHLRQATGAGLIIGAHAEGDSRGWQVTLRSTEADSPLTSVVARADNVLDAARQAADRLSLVLGLTPPPPPDEVPGLTTLVRQVEAARLAQQMDLARELIGSASAEWQSHPEIRFQLARLDYYSHRLDAAQAALGELLHSTTATDDPVFRARVLLELGGVHYRRAEHQQVRALLEEASGLLDPQQHPGMLGLVRRMLGMVALAQGEAQEATPHFAYARWVFDNTGDIQGLALLLNSLGLNSVLHGEYHDALHYFEQAVERYILLHDLGEELGVRSNIVRIHLRMLNPSPALAMEPRLRELAEHAVNPEVAVTGELARVSVLFESGQSSTADALLQRVWTQLEKRNDLHQARLEALLIRAERLAELNDPQAIDLATEVLAWHPEASELLRDEVTGRARLIRLRLYDLSADAQALVAAVDEAIAWAAEHPGPMAQLVAALARAGQAAREDDEYAAAVAYRQAMNHAEQSRTPAYVRVVAEQQLSWLLLTQPSATDQILMLAEQLARYDGRHYAAALLRLRAYHAAGSLAAWRQALARAQELSGERRIPNELLQPPGSPAPL